MAYDVFIINETEGFKWYVLMGTIFPVFGVWAIWNEVTFHEFIISHFVTDYISVKDTGFKAKVGGHKNWIEMDSKPDSYFGIVAIVLFGCATRR